MHAVRQRIMLALADAQEPMPWDDPRVEQGRYTAKLSHLSARCRLSEADEGRMPSPIEPETLRYRESALSPLAPCYSLPSLMVCGSLCGGAAS